MPDVPKGAKVPADHKSPVQVEAEGGGTLGVTWRGHTFTVPAEAEDWSVTTTLAFEEGKAATGVRGILGTDQWADLMKTKPTNRDLSDLFDTIAKTMGLENAGE